MDFLFDNDTLGLMRSVKDHFDPLGLANPDKIFPKPGKPVLPRPSTTPPGAFHAPSTAEETSALLAGMTAPVRIRGNGTKSVLPAFNGPVISTEKMNAIIDHDLSNFTIETGAGATIANINAALGAHRQFIPFDVPHPDRATVSGTISAGYCGIRNSFLPRVSDTCLGVTAVLSDGRIIRLGGKNVKDVAGYNLASLFCGSFGTLGVIVSATLKLLPVPEKRDALSADVGSVAEGIAFYQAMIAERLDPAFAVITHDAGSTILHAGYEGPEDSVHRSMERSAVLLGKTPAIRPPSYDGLVGTLTAAAFSPEHGRTRVPSFNELRLAALPDDRFVTDVVIDLNSATVFTRAPLPGLPFTSPGTIPIDSAADLNAGLKKLFDAKHILNVAFPDNNT
jgi:FAD/FMN-containing dehydrogenase